MLKFGKILWKHNKLRKVPLWRHKDDHFYCGDFVVVVNILTLHEGSYAFIYNVKQQVIAKIIIVDRLVDHLMWLAPIAAPGMTLVSPYSITTWAAVHWLQNNWNMSAVGGRAAASNIKPSRLSASDLKVSACSSTYITAVQQWRHKVFACDVSLKIKVRRHFLSN